MVVCTLVEKYFDRKAKNPPKDIHDLDLFCTLNFYWLLGEELKDKAELKLEIVKEFFKITNVPVEVLPELKFSPALMEKRCSIELSPTWENKQKRLSKPFDSTKLFNLIRKSYANL